MSAYARISESQGILCIFIQFSNSIHRSTQTCIEHSLAVFATISHDYLLELNIFKENAFCGLQKILLDTLPRNFYI